MWESVWCRDSFNHNIFFQDLPTTRLSVSMRQHLHRSILNEMQQIHSNEDIDVFHIIYAISHSMRFNLPGSLHGISFYNTSYKSV